MTRFTLFLLCSALGAGAAHAQDATFTGSVPANISSPMLVSEDPAAVLRPGQVVTVKLSGEVDINQERKKKRKCLVAGIGCKTARRTEHNFRHPGQLGALFKLVPVGGGPERQVTVGAEAEQLMVPLDAPFAAKYKLVANLSGAGSLVDPGRSVGAYKVTAEVRADARAAQYGIWLESNPQVDIAISDDVLDAVTRQHGATLSAALRQYASRRYPLSSADNRDAHGKLVAKAYELAPSTPENSLALAEFYTSIGLDQMARDSLRRAETLWKDSPQPRTAAAERGLGETYFRQAMVLLKDKGKLDFRVAASASAYLDKAIESLRRSKRSDLVAAALVEKAQLLRSFRTRKALIEATVALDEALKLAPDRIEAANILAVSDQGIVAERERPVLALAPVDAAHADPQDILIGDVPAAYDPFGQYLIVTRGPVLQWRKLAAPEAIMRSISIDEDAVVAAAAAGRALVHMKGAGPYDRRIALISAASEQLVTLVEQFGCWDASSELSRDGALAVTTCGSNSHNIYRLGDAAPVRIAGYDGSSIVAAGPASCGVLRGVLEEDDQGDNHLIFSLDRLNGTVLPLLSPAGTPMRFDANVERRGVTFSGDGKILILAGERDIAVFSCATGLREETPLAYDYAYDPLPYEADDVYWWEEVRLDWVTPTDLAVAQKGDVFVGGSRHRFDLIQVELVDWNDRSRRRYRVSDTALEQRSDKLDRFLIAPAAVGQAPRTPRMAHVKELLASGEALPDETKNPVRELSSWSVTGRMLTGGRFLLRGARDQSSSLVDTASREQRLFPAHRGAGALGSADRWFAFEQAPSGELTSLSLFQGASELSKVALPGPDPAYLGRFFDFTDGYYWPKDEGSLPEQDLDRVRGDISLITLRQGLGFTIRPLATTGGLEARLLCGTPQARTAAGELRTLNLTFPYEQVTLATAGAEAVTFQAIPAHERSYCLQFGVIPGPRPGILRVMDVPGPVLPGIAFEWWNGSQWVKLSQRLDRSELRWNPFFPYRAWTSAQGKLLLLTPASERALADRRKTNPAATLWWQLRMVSSDGALAPACASCDAIDLVAAEEKWLAANCPKGTAMDLATGSECLVEPDDFVKADPTGEMIVYPEKEELVVAGLDGRERLRVPFGRPMHFDGRYLGVRHSGPVAGTGAASLTVYRVE